MFSADFFLMCAIRSNLRFLKSEILKRIEEHRFPSETSQFQKMRSGVLFWRTPCTHETDLCYTPSRARTTFSGCHTSLIYCLSVFVLTVGKRIDSIDLIDRFLED
jgi:hypothetical protein